jgi:ATP-binding cassette subfamily B protein
VLDLLRRVWLEVRTYWLPIAAMFAVSMLATPVALLLPVPLKITVDSVLGSEKLPEFLTVLLPASVSDSQGALLVFAAYLLVVVSLIRTLQGMGGWLLGEYVGQKLVLHFRSKLFEKVQQISLSYHDLKGISDSIY